MKHRVNKIFFLALVTSILYSCKKESDHPQWDVDVLAPLVISTLDISNLINDTLLQSDTNHVLHVVYEKNLYNLNLDSLVNIPDTVLTQALSFPLFVNIGPATPFYNNTTQLVFGTNGPQLRKAILRNGTLIMTAVNYTVSGLNFQLDIPGAIRDGNPFSQSGFVGNATPGDSVVQDFIYDLSGYDLNLTGTTGSSFNTLSYNLSVATDINGDTIHVTPNQKLFKVNQKFSGIFPEYVKGYLGSDTITAGPSSTAIDIFNKIQSGMLNLSDATLTATIENGIGADARFKVNNIISVNSRTGTSVPLLSNQLINQNININRATETGVASNPVNSTQNIIVLNSSNSNIISFIENLPDALSYSMRLTTNPLGNISGYNDFVYADYLVSTRMRFEMPLSFSSDHLTFVDTTDFISDPEKTFENFKSGKLKLVAENGFPFRADIG
ncbi:MAG: hypothetical protein JJE25_11800, partial [Bacteroidia bacterium]|nr:hypothetical protein [Bacteroidia bacterium]